jgi:hypothetical protein
VVGDWVVWKLTWQVTGLYDDDVACSLYDDCASDCVVRSNHRVTRGPIKGRHVAQCIFPMSTSPQICYNLQGIRTPELHGR